MIYSRLGEKADLVIKRVTSSERHEWIVVSSDRDIANHAWSVNSVPVPSETFSRFIEESDPEQGEDRNEFNGSEGGGGGHKASRKEKALTRALRKL